MTTNQHVAQHNLNRVNFVIKVTRRAWMNAAKQVEAPKVRVCMQCGYTGDFTHIYNGAHPECPMCEGD
jgi:rubrerythrin